MAGRLPGAQIVLQLDEPSLPVVLAGGVPTASGFGSLRAVEEQLVRTGLAEVLAAAIGAGAARQRCIAARPARRSRCSGRPGRAVWFDPALRSAAHDELLGTAVEAGVGLWLGVVPAGSADDPPCSATWATRSGSYGACGAGSASRPTCCPLRSADPGLRAGRHLSGLRRAALRRVREPARAIAEDPEG